MIDLIIMFSLGGLIGLLGNRLGWSMLKTAVIAFITGFILNFLIFLFALHAMLGGIGG